jgi:hypothetical protein
VRATVAPVSICPIATNVRTHLLKSDVTIRPETEYRAGEGHRRIRQQMTHWYHSSYALPEVRRDNQASNHITEQVRAIVVLVSICPTAGIVCTHSLLSHDNTVKHNDPRQRVTPASSALFYNICSDTSHRL